MKTKVAVLVLVSILICSCAPEASIQRVAALEVATEAPAIEETITKEPVATEEAGTTETPTEPPLACLTLLTPFSGAEIASIGLVSFSWTPMDKAGVYVLNIILPSGEIVPIETNEAFVDLSMENFVAGGEYHWQVIAQNSSGGEICSSEVASFVKPVYQLPESSSDGSTADTARCVVFTSTRDANYEIYSMRPDGTDAIRLTDNPLDDYNPSISPDGQKIVFESRRDNDYEIYVMNLDGSEQLRITYSEWGDGFPSWSPDGTRIAFTSWRDENSEIYVMNADGTGQINLTNNSGSDTVPSWSPDGSQIVFVSSRDDPNMLDPISMIYIMNADGTNPRRLLDSEARWPAWSPDGKKVAFVSYANGFGELHLFDLASNVETTLITSPIMDGKLAWSPEGTEILFTSYIDNAHGELWRVNIATSELEQLTSGGVFDGSADWKCE